MVAWFSKDEYEQLTDSLVESSFLRQLQPTLEKAQSILQAPKPAAAVGPIEIPDPPEMRRSEPVFKPLDLNALMAQSTSGQDIPSAQPAPFQTLDLDAMMEPLTPKPSPYSSALTTLGGTPEAEALTRPGGIASTAGAPEDIEGYIRYAATRRGIDPDVAVRVAMSEGGVTDPVRQSEFVQNGKREESYGPFQLFLGGGLGNAALQRGIDPRNPAQWKQSIEFALDEAAKGGWGPWYGAARVGIAPRQGLENARAIGVSADARPATSGANVSSGTGEGTYALREGASLTPDQFTAGTTLSSEEAYAACGPAAAIAFARRNGRNPTLDEAVNLAREVGWTPQQGMAGPASQVKLLEKMGIAATLGGVDENKIRADVQRGNPVIIDTPGHYFVAERYDPQSGKFDLGQSARALKASAGQTWYTLGELARLGMGAARSAIFMDSPESPSPSVVAGRSTQAFRVENAPELVQAVDSVSTPAPRLKSGLTVDEAVAQGGTMAQLEMPGVPGEGNAPGAVDGSSTTPLAASPPARDDWRSGGQVLPNDDGGRVGIGASPSSGQVSISGGVKASSGVPGAGDLPSRDIHGDYAPRAVEPGDFELPNRSTASGTAGPALDLAPTPPPGGAVEPGPAVQAPASSGNPIVDLFSDFGRKLSGILMPQKPDYSQPARDIQERQSTLTGEGPSIADVVAAERANPSPSRQVFDTAAGALRGMAEGSQQDMAAYQRLQGRQLQGETLTPEEEQEMASAAVRVVGDISGLQNVGKTVPGVIGAAKTLPTPSPTAGIVSRAQADEAGRLTPGTQPPGLGGAAGRAIGSGVGAAYEESQQEGATPESVLRAGVGGAATSIARTTAGRLLGPGRGRPPVDVVGRVVQAASQPNQPKTPAEAWDAVTETIKADAPPPITERLTELAKGAASRTNWFDGTRPLREITQQAERAIGRPLQPHENAWLQARLLPGVRRAAEQDIMSGLGPAVKGLDDQAYERLNGYLAALDAVDKGNATGNMGRKFGQFSGTEAEQALEHLRTTLSPFEMKDLDRRASLVRDHVNMLRDRMEQSGLLSPEQVADFKQKYPNYSPINFVDWMEAKERQLGTPATLSVSQNGVKALTEHGASYQRQAPLEALRDATFAIEQRAARNEAANAFADYTKIDPAFKSLFRPANQEAAAYLGQPIAQKRPSETGFSIWQNGKKLDFYLDNALADAIRQDRGLYNGPGAAAMQAASAAFRAGATGSNILFLIPNAIGDAMTAMVRGESPGSLFRGYVQAFTHGPEYEAFLRAGGGYSGMIESGQGAVGMRELRGTINTADQLKQYISWANPLKLAQEIGERVEMAPRVGMYGQAIREGATPAEAALAGRDITMDFARAGLYGRAINQFVPFFNVGLQAPAQVARFLSKTSPGEVLRPTQAQALARVGTYVVAPVIALEAYNRMWDSYKDVPQYDKDRALIIMDPRGPGAVDPDTGRPTPRYALIGLREWTPFAIATREAIGRATGTEDRNWIEVADAILRNSSPISVQEGVSSLLPPWLTVPIEMQHNWDGFRGRQIIPDSIQDRLPEEQYTATTSETSKLIGRAIKKPPAMIEFAIRGFGTGVAGQALAAGDMALRAAGVAPPAESKGRVRDIPVVGGLAGRFYREQGGEISARMRADNEQQFQDIMRSAGLQGSEVQPPSWEIKGIRLSTAEHDEYFARFNDAFASQIRTFQADPRWKTATPEMRLNAVKNAASRAREQASQQVISTYRDAMRQRQPAGATR